MVVLGAMISSADLYWCNHDVTFVVSCGTVGCVVPAVVLDVEEGTVGNSVLFLAALYSLSVKRASSYGEPSVSVVLLLGSVSL